MNTLGRESPNTRLTMQSLGSHRCGAAAPVALMGLVLVAVACSETFDAGASRSHGLLPVDERNPIILVNDNARDNWQGEYAMLLANGGGPRLVGIVVDQTSPAPWPDLDTNVTGWNELVKAARDSGMQNIPDPTPSVGAPLVRPANGDIDSTQKNDSKGAHLIVDMSKQLSLPYRPLVVATGVPLTDVADAYLIDPTVVDRVVVVSSLGAATASGGNMGSPCGELDPWADTIVAERFRYVQVSAFYDQLTDVPDVSKLPSNKLGDWMKDKQPGLWHWQPASDQVAVAAVGILGFATNVQRVSLASAADSGAAAVPDLTLSPKGPGWLVTECAGTVATKRFWELLLNPATFAH